MGSRVGARPPIRRCGHKASACFVDLNLASSTTLRRAVIAASLFLRGQHDFDKPHKFWTERHQFQSIEHARHMHRSTLINLECQPMDSGPLEEGLVLRTEPD